MLPLIVITILICIINFFADIILSSAGWIGVNVPIDKNVIFNAWTPECRGIVIRDPPLIPYGVKLRGKRIRGSLAYLSKKAFLK